MTERYYSEAAGRWYTYGDPERFWSYVDKSGECWLWTGAISGGGYGRFRVPGRSVQAHRHAYERLVGPIPTGMQLDHLCRVRACVNPAHLEPVTAQENLLRGETFNARNAAKTHCLRGHPLSGKNLYFHRNRRVCRECIRQNQRAMRKAG